MLVENGKKKVNRSVYVVYSVAGVIMKNKKLCKSCKYHAVLGHGVGVACLRIIHTNDACIKNGVDRRGDDPESCLVMESGKRIIGKPKDPEWQTWTYGKYRSV